MNSTTERTAHRLRIYQQNMNKSRVAQLHFLNLLARDKFDIAYRNHTWII